MKKISLPFSVAYSWQFISSSVIILSCIGLLLLTQLNTLLPGYSASEKAYVDTTTTPAQILDNPVFLPHKAISFGFHYLTNDNFLSARLASVLIGSLSILLFYYCSSRWYSRRTAFLATVLFASSAWFLHVARIGIPDVTYVASLLLLVVLGYALKSARHPLLISSLLILTAGASVFLPGFILFILLGVVFLRGTLVSTGKALNKKQLGVLNVVALVAVAPVLYTSIKNPSTILSLLGKPDIVPNIATFVKQLVYVPLSIIGRAPGNPEVHLGHLPYLDIISVVLLLAGIYYYTVYRRSLRTKLLVSGLVSGILIASITASATNAVLLPIIYLIIAAGITVLINQWLTVFPKNPVARAFGIILVCVIVSVSCIYSLRSYFIAWPQTPATKDAYRQIL